MGDERTEIVGSIVNRSGTVHRVRPADPNQIVEATIVIRRPITPARTAGATREEIEKSLAANPADVTAVTGFAQRSGLAVEEVSPAKRTVRLKGSAQNMNRAFGIHLAYFDGPSGAHLSYDGPLTVPADVSGKIVAVLGLDQQPVAKPR
jgi:kumamolisin